MLVDGKAIVSCQQSLAKVAGKAVVTLEGVDADERDRFADAFAACGGLQCGFCIPGIVMRAKAQIDKKGADLDRSDMARHLGAHLCRCTGYVKILDAIEAVAKGKRSSPRLAARSASRCRSTRRASSRSATAATSTTCACPACCTPRSHLTDHARADIVAIDTSARRRGAGVVARVHRRRHPRRAAGRASSTRTGR